MELRGCVLLPGQDGWLGMEEVVDLHKTKGLMGMAIQGLIRPAGPVHPSPRTMSPAPHFTLEYVLGQYPNPSPGCSSLYRYSPDLEQSYDWDLQSG